MPITAKEAKQLNDAKSAILAQWREACMTQGIPADSKFVVFADTNEAARKHNKLMGEFFKLRNRIARNLARRERKSTQPRNRFLAVGANSVSRSIRTDI